MNEEQQEKLAKHWDAVAYRYSEKHGFCIVHRLMFTYAIYSDCDWVQHRDRWCYHTQLDAICALHEWLDNPEQVEPEGWHRHPYSGRRRDEDGKEYINL